MSATERPLLVIDESHHLHNEARKDLRLLTNYAMDVERHLTLPFVGLTELRRDLSMRPVTCAFD